MSVESKGQGQSVSSIKIEEKGKSKRRDFDLKVSNSFTYTNITSKIKLEESDEASTKLTRCFSWHFLLNESFRSKVFESSGFNSNIESTSIKATIDSRHKAELKKNNISFIDKNFSSLLENISSSFLQSQSSGVDKSSTSRDNISKLSAIKGYNLSRSKNLGIRERDQNYLGKKVAKNNMLDEKEDSKNMKTRRSKSISIGGSASKVIDDTGKVLPNQMIDRDLWTNAMARARMQEAKDESIPSDIYSDSKIITSSDNTDQKYQNNQNRHQDPVAQVQSNSSKKKYKNTFSTLENDSYFKETYFNPSLPEVEKRKDIKSKDKQIFYEDGRNHGKSKKDIVQAIKESSESSENQHKSGSSNTMKEKENQITSNEEKSPFTGNNNTDSNSNSQSSRQDNQDTKQDNLIGPTITTKQSNYVVEAQQNSNFEIFGKSHENNLSQVSVVNTSKVNSSKSGSHYELNKLNNIKSEDYLAFLEGKVENLITTHKGSIFLQNTLGKFSNDAIIQIFNEVRIII